MRLKLDELTAQTMLASCRGVSVDHLPAPWQSERFQTPCDFWPWQLKPYDNCDGLKSMDTGPPYHVHRYGPTDPTVRATSNVQSTYWRQFELRNVQGNYIFYECPMQDGGRTNF